MQLPFNLDVPIKTSNGDVYAHGIIMSNPEGFKYLYSTYIDVDFDLQSCDFFFNDYRSPYAYRAPLIRESVDLSRFFLVKNHFMSIVNPWLMRDVMLMGRAMIFIYCIDLLTKKTSKT